jgi:hypothetical protein
MRALSGERLLGLAVRLRGLQLGRPVELLLDRETLRAVGLDVLCRDDVHRFLPFPTASVSEEGIVIPSALFLLDEDELDFYRSRTIALSTLRGRAVTWNGRLLGTVRDVAIAASGDLVDVIVETDGELARIPFDATIEFAPETRSAA